MTPAHFLKTRVPAWHVLETLLSQIRGRGLTSLGDVEVRRLTRLYPSVVVDLAQAKTYDLSQATQTRINQLAIAAHGIIYRSPRHKPLATAWGFFRQGYPRLFRRSWVYIALATALFLVGFLGAYVSTRLRPSNAYIFVPGELDLADMKPGVSAADISERFRKMPNAPMASGIMANNVSVAFNAFAFGIAAGVGTCYLLLLNGALLGGFVGHFTNHGLSFELWSFLAGHGTLEIFAILVAAAAGLRLGLSLVLPGRQIRSASLRQGAQEAALLVLGTIPMFVIAGLIEGFITPSYIPGEVKIALGLTVAGLVISYLLGAGRSTVGTGS